MMILKNIGIKKPVLSIISSSAKKAEKVKVMKISVLKTFIFISAQHNFQGSPYYRLVLLQNEGEALLNDRLSLQGL